MISLFEPVREASLPVDLMMRGGRGVSLLEFLAIPDLDEMEAEGETAAPGAAPEPKVDEQALKMSVMIDAAREESGAEMRRVCEVEAAARLEQERMRVAEMARQFARDRQAYFAAVEEQVVKLALAVARRVLAREVEADRMHLAATVRAALTRVQDGSKTVLRVPADEALDWAEMGLGELDSARVEVVGDVRLAAGECVLETSVGRVELGVKPQLEEIESAFAELTEWREA